MSLSLHIENLSYRFDANSPLIFKNLSLQFSANSWTCLLGQSGCGKTTLLKLIAGFLQEKSITNQSEYLINHQENNESQGNFSAFDELNARIDHHTHIAYMGQQDLLFPWLSVLHNVCLESYLKTGKLTPEEIEKATHLLSEIGLSQECDSMPSQLSGGMRQRVALARTLMQDKSMVLMDEPFSAVDAVTRHQLQTLACDLLKEKTVLFVTHDPQEALRLADRILIMKNANQASATNTAVNLIDFPFNQAQMTPRNIDNELVMAQAKLIHVLSEQGQ